MNVLNEIQHPDQVFKQISAKLLEEQKSSGVDLVESFTDELEDIKERVSKGPGDIIGQVKDTFKNFMEQIEEAIADPGKLKPSGALACINCCYGNAVAGKLKELKKEAEQLWAVITKMAEAIMEPLKKLGEVLQRAMESITRAIKRMMKLPKELEELADTLKSASDLGKVDLSDIKKCIDINALLGPLDDLSGLKGTIAPVIKEVKEGIEQIVEFIGAAPDKVKNAFKVPPPLCCLTPAVMAMAPAPMTAMLEKLDLLKGLDLKPLVDVLAKTKKSVAELEVGSIKDPMEKFSNSATEQLNAIEPAIMAAKAAGGVQNIGSAIMGVFK